MSKYLITISYTYEVEAFNEAKAICEASKMHEEHIHTNETKGSHLTSVERME